MREKESPSVMEGFSFYLCMENARNAVRIKGKTPVLPFCCFYAILLGQNVLTRTMRFV